MPPCNKKLNISSWGDKKTIITVKCVAGENHEGNHQWQVWTDDDNLATGKKGVIKFIS